MVDPAISRAAHMKFNILKKILIAVAIVFAAQCFPITGISNVQAQDDDTPQTCKIGVYLTSLHDLKSAAKTFAADMWVWSDCPNEELTPLQSMEFVNANSSDGKLDYTEIKDGVVWSQRKVSGVFRDDWDVHNYPFDRHTLIIEMEEAAYDTSAFVYTADKANSTFSPDIQLDGWQVTNFELLEGETLYTTTFGDPTLEGSGESVYSKLEVAISIVRTDLTSFLKLIGPVYIAFGVALVSLLLYMENASALNPQVGLQAASLFATVVNLSRASDALGLSEHLTLVDQIHIVTLVFILTVTMMVIQSQRSLRTGMTPDEVSQKNFRRFIYLGVSYIVLNIGLISFAINQG